MSDSFDPRTHSTRPDELAGRVIAITGASSGIGRAVALACARFGATVILVGRNARKLENVLQQKPGSGVKIRRLNCELRDLPFTP